MFKLGGVHCLGCAIAIEEALRAQPSVTDIRLDWKADVVHVGYDPARIDPERIEEIITQTGCDCVPVGAEEEYYEAVAPPERCFAKAIERLGCPAPEVAFAHRPIEGSIADAPALHSHLDRH